MDSVSDIRHKIKTTSTKATDLLKLHQCGDYSFRWRTITPTEIKKVVAKFSNSKGMDYLWLSNYIIKKPINIISGPLAFLFNRCLEFGIFPTNLKTKNIKLFQCAKKGKNMTSKITDRFP